MYDLIEKSDILVRNLPGAGYFKQEKESLSMNSNSKKMAVWDISCQITKGYIIIKVSWYNGKKI